MDAYKILGQNVGIISLGIDIIGIWKSLNLHKLENTLFENFKSEM